MSDALRFWPLAAMLCGSLGLAALWVDFLRRRPELLDHSNNRPDDWPEDNFTI
jgi:hypothetical protein